MVIRHLGADKGTGAEMSPAVINGSLLRTCRSAIGQFFPPVPGNRPRNFEKVNSSQFPSPVSKVANRLDHTA